MAINFQTKVAQIFGDHLGYYGKWYYLCKYYSGYFWGKYWNIGLLLIPTSGRTDHNQIRKKLKYSFSYEIASSRNIEILIHEFFISKSRQDIKVKAEEEECFFSRVRYQSSSSTLYSFFLTRQDRIFTNASL